MVSVYLSPKDGQRGGIACDKDTVFHLLVQHHERRNQGEILGGSRQYSVRFALLDFPEVDVHPAVIETPFTAVKMRIRPSELLQRYTWTPSRASCFPSTRFSKLRGLTCGSPSDSCFAICCTDSG